MQSFDFLESTQSLDSDGQPFSWLGSDEMNPEKIDAIFESFNQIDEIASLRFCMMIYILHRRPAYINYMAGGKRIFDLVEWRELKRPCKMLVQSHTEYLANRGVHAGDWCPHYELQRLNIYTGIHWTWLHWAWVQCEKAIWKGGQAWQIAKLERIRPI